MKILVLGGTGAMGVPVVRMLADQGNEVYVTSRRKKENAGFIRYIMGDAHDMKFLSSLLKEKYDAMIDFMVYTEEELRQRIDVILDHVNHYIFLSSARVYAYSDKPLTEESDRLLDVCSDKEYLATTEYGLSKAREENVIKNSSKTNWTIIRPYITYNSNRLQLGVLEKEYWLQRALSGKKIVFSKEIADKYTTMTFGEDVSRHIAKLVGKPEAFGEVYHITNDKAVKWSEVLNVYREAIKREIGRDVEILLTDNDDGLNVLFGTKYQIRYDRAYNRLFDSTKVNEITGDVDYMDTFEGLDKCISDFIKEGKVFLCIDWKLEGYFDKLTNEKQDLSEIDNLKHKVVYLLCRYTPYVKWRNNKLLRRIKSLYNLMMS